MKIYTPRRKKANNPIEKWSTDIHRYFIGKEMQNSS